MPKAEPELQEKVIDHIQRNIIKNIPFFSDNTLTEMKELTKLLKDPNRNKFNEQIESFLQLSIDEKNKIYIKALNMHDVIETEKKYWELTKVDRNNKEFRILNHENNQEIIICGCDQYPNENLNYILSVIKKEKNEINLLIVQDFPVLNKPVDFKEKHEEVEPKLSKNIYNFFKDKELKDELMGEDLEVYTKSFINNEIFVMDMKDKKIYQKVNNMLYVPSELGSSVVHFLLHANPEKESKV